MFKPYFTCIHSTLHVTHATRNTPPHFTTHIFEQNLKSFNLLLCYLMFNIYLLYHYSNNVIPHSSYFQNNVTSRSYTIF